MTSKELIRKIGKFRVARAAQEIGADDLALINRWVPEGEPRATAEDVYVREAMVCNDMVDHYSTRFTKHALGQIVELMPGVNFMRNHSTWQSDDLPIGRFFSARLVEKDGATYVAAKFYWERGTDSGDEMERKFALGLWREVSISWWMSDYTNSVDGGPMDESPYYPGQKLANGDVVVGIMDGIEEVNEVSVVHLGGQKDTSIGPVREFNGRDVVLMAMARMKQSSPGDPWSQYFRKAEAQDWERYFSMQ